MKKYQGFLLATTSGLAAAGSAQAADLPVKAAPAVAPALSWTGPYIGLHAGAAWQQAHMQLTGKYNYTARSESDSGFIGGGQIGYNWQKGNLVFGVEVDGSGLSGKPTAIDASSNPAKSFSSKISWLSTARVRAGLAVTDTMAYVTGGVAVGGVRSHFTDPGQTDITSYSNTRTRVGWAIGGGIEHMWNRNVTIALEGLFVDLGHHDWTFTNPSAGTGSKTTNFRANNQALIGRFKINYKW
jgi:outer membrane immunogenic protein